MKRLITTIALVIGLGSSGGCFLFHDDYPDDHCDSDNDCFRSMGEACNLSSHRCEVPGTNAPAPERADDYQACVDAELELEAAEEVIDAE